MFYIIEILDSQVVRAADHGGGHPTALARKSS
jgi:hypothetical protein